jgi:hypothetical protein
MNDSPYFIPVVVIGAGPTGVTAAINNVIRCYKRLPLRLISA